MFFRVTIRAKDQALLDDSDGVFFELREDREGLVMDFLSFGGGICGGFLDMVVAFSRAVMFHVLTVTGVLALFESETKRIGMYNPFTEE